MKYIVSLISAFLLLFGASAVAQEPEAAPVHAKWEFSAEKKGQGEFILKFKAKIDQGWKLMAASMGDDDPNTRIVFDSLSDSRAKILALADAAAPQSAAEPLLDNMEIKYFENEAEVTATIKYNSDSIKNLRGNVIYYVLKGEEILPEEAPFTFVADAAGNLAGEEGGLKADAAIAERIDRKAVDLKNPVMKVGDIGKEGNSSPWLIFIFGVIGGLLALVTPCVFPMIPLTVSFFTKSAQDKKKGITSAVTYGFFIFLIYLAVSLPFHLLSSADPAIFNNISTNVWLNVIFFAVFVVFALSFFGLFEITLPSSLASKTDSKADKSSIIGIFFMALTLVVVSFSCTGPILGTLLASAGSAGSTNGAWMLTAGLAGFGVSLGLPFALFALFPNWLNSLPKSGGWLTSVKVVLGFIELALAVKFLSNADLVMHWGILHRETFFLIWIIIGLLTTLYLFGVIRFPHDSPIKKLGKVRIFFGILFAAFTLYLIPGITNTKYSRIKLMSGFAPPMSYSWYGNNAHENGAVEPDVMNDYFKALALAKEKNKPVMIDFTGWACVNCRNMEENVWTDPEVHALIQDNFVLVSLYTDDRKKLPEEEQFKYTHAEGWSKKIVTVGDHWATFQRVNFINQSQPLYVLITPDEQLLTWPVAYEPDIQKYADWLRAGLEGWKKVNATANK
ncbi:cytochrome c biogenesis protein CcdA [Chitinophaga sp.]|uniref:protein-disulfide reductase DsbD family protein n=1 Tax=Chitinophaga sp. TaxID=1869181 RepID=UPI002631A396|nr:cytochrome c biogenesis protein CcdA [uncultured Chitinophaga sp.]